MPSISGRAGKARGLALAGALGVIIAAPLAGPAFAGDDGQAPIWTGLGGLVGLAHDDNSDQRIDYRERGRLVLPPKMALPPPLPPVAQRTAAWPLDQEIEKARKKRQEMLNILKSQSDLQALRDGHRLSPDQLRGDHSTPGQETANRCGSQSNTRGCDWIPFRNVFETVGLVKPDEIVAGQEPDRDWLTDPPKGYRLPATTTTATQDDTKKVDQRDPKAFLLQQSQN